MGDYETYYRRYHTDRIQTMSQSQKEIHCKGCQNPKTFIEDESALYYSCGTKGNSKCGTQYVIHLPEYVNVTDSYSLLQMSIDGTLEKHSDDLSQQPLDTLHKLTDMDIDTQLAKQKKTRKNVSHE